MVSGAFLLVRREMHLTDTWHELIVSATIAAALITALISGKDNCILTQHYFINLSTSSTVIIGLQVYPSVYFRKGQ